MRREDLIAFARRDWQLLAAMKERFWIEQKRMSASDVSFIANSSPHA
jgi:hypothetical protein